MGSRYFSCSVVRRVPIVSTSSVIVQGRVNQSHRRRDMQAGGVRFVLRSSSWFETGSGFRITMDDRHRDSGTIAIDTT
jgi:hypothetical protein